MLRVLRTAINLVLFLYIFIYWGDPDVDGRIILRWIFRKWDMRV
jgi:hypothetical protein